jgi:MFS transporter, NNP family, nitrate/nitrite transporter
MPAGAFAFSLEALWHLGPAGGLGGFVPPLVMGFVYSQYGSYAVGLAALALVAAATLVLAATAVRNVARTRGSPMIRPA